MKMNIIGENLSPQCFLPNGKLICYHAGNLIVVNDDHIEDKYPLFHSRKEQIFDRIKPLFRLLRLGIRAAIAIDDSHIVISVGNMLYEYDFHNHRLSEGYYIGEGIRPLAFTQIKGIEGFEDCIVFGGYLSNKAKKPVQVYKHTSKDKWQVVYSFEQGAINHVHNIIPDPYRNCLWIFTGDFNESAAIWKVTDNFQKVERVLCNDQMYRGCVCYPTEEGLLYATDAPFAQNYIYLMRDDYSFVKLSELDGSCIYSCQVGSQFIFSSTVEPDGRKNNRWTLLFDRTRGAGIKDMYVHMYTGNVQSGFKEIYKERKDLWPFLFQFGAIRFPHGDNPTGKLYFQPVATNKNDLRLIYTEIGW